MKHRTTDNDLLVECSARVLPEDCARWKVECVSRPDLTMAGKQDNVQTQRRADLISVSEAFHAVVNIKVKGIIYVAVPMDIEPVVISSAWDGTFSSLIDGGRIIEDADILWDIILNYAKTVSRIRFI